MTTGGLDKPIRLENSLKHYAWGSTDAIANLVGLPNPARQPMAEWWISAHPQTPSLAVLDSGKVPLDRLISDHPDDILGAGTAQQFGRALPFLWKILSAAAPLSLQCHPDAAQARAGYLREEQKGIARDARERCYRDPHPKPELVVALSEFIALKGFRQPRDICAAFAAVPHPGLENAINGLERRGDLRAFLAGLFALDKASVVRLVNAVARAGGWVAALSQRYPGDIAALAPLFLHEVKLAPGQALFLRAGELHAYLGGTALEIMGNSDNVLRGGLTDKHIDVAELLATLSFSPNAPEPLEPSGDDLQIYPTPADSFVLGRITKHKLNRHRRHAVDIVLCLGGVAEIKTSSGPLELEPGQSALVPFAAGDYQIIGSPDVWIASVPPPVL